MGGTLIPTYYDVFTKKDNMQMISLYCFGGVEFCLFAGIVEEN
jgi:hypothetical protein